MLLAALACAPTELPARALPPARDPDGIGGPSATDPEDSAPSPAHSGAAAPCPPDMVLAGVCIDRYEAFLDGGSPWGVPAAVLPAVNAAGEMPQGYVSALVAAASCALAGKRLCTSEEWLAACRGPEGRLYPYGEAYAPGACNDARDLHPVLELFGPDATFDATELNDPRLNQLPDSLAPSGSFADCVTPEGIADLHGNLHEWVEDADGTFRGGFYVDAVLNGPGCTYATTAHDAGYHDYSTGFRCCADPAD